MLFAFSFTSCRKEYNCTCDWSYTYTYNDGSFTYSDSDQGTYEYFIGRVKKDDAASICENYKQNVEESENLNMQADLYETFVSNVDCSESKY